MAVSAADYPWSSAGAHCGERGDSSGLLALGEWFEQMPATEWQATLRVVSESGGLSLNPLRIHTRTGRPLGDDAFLSKVETLLGRRVRPQPTGRPMGWRKQKARAGKIGG